MKTPVWLLKSQARKEPEKWLIKSDTVIPNMTLSEGKGGQGKELKRPTFFEVSSVTS